MINFIKTYKKSINFKLFSLIIPLLTISVLILILYFKGLLYTQIQENANLNMYLSVKIMEQELDLQSNFIETFARSIELKSKEISKEEYIQLLKELVNKSKFTYGSGIWFEPYKYKSNTRYFGHYVFKKDDIAVYTDNYNDSEYNYHNWSWYKNGISASNSVYWSSPYYDKYLNTTILTVSAPFYDINHKLLGVVTNDIDLILLQQLLTRTKISENSWCFIIDKNQNYVIHKDLKKVMNTKISTDPNKSLAQLTDKLMNFPTGILFFNDENEKNMLFYKHVPNVKWVLCYVIPEKDMYNKTLLDLFLGFILFTCILSLILVAFVNNIVINRLKKMFNIVNKVADGDFNNQIIEDKSTDEIGLLGNSFNVMTNNIKTLIEEINYNKLHLQTILDGILDVIITIDSNGKIYSSNSMIEKIFGYKSLDIKGMDIRFLLPEFTLELPKECIIMRGNSCMIYNVKCDDKQFKGLRKNGELFPISVEISEIYAENENIFILVIHDESEKTKVNRIKNEFVSVVSHELRTPLTSIRGALGLLIHDISNSVNDESKELLDIAYNNSSRLINLVNDILDTEKIESDKINFNYTDIEVLPLLKDVIQINKTYAMQYNVTFKLIETTKELKIKADKDRLVQVLTNLLSNAAKFSTSGGTVEVFYEQEAENKVKISVKDFGNGIPDEFNDKIFQKFVQVDSSDSRKKGGTGLGLSISKSIIEKMGGNIGFTTKINKGTTFYFSLPESIEKL